LFDRYDIGFQIAKLVAYSNEPLEEIKYIQHVLKQLYELYKIKNDIDKDLNVEFKDIRNGKTETSA